MLSRLVAAALGKFEPSLPSLAHVVMFATALIAAAIAAAFAAYAAYGALSISIEPHWAAAIVAGGAMLLAAILVAIARPRPPPAPPARARAPSGDLAPELLAELIRGIRASPKEAATIALVAGIVAGACPELLKAVGERLDPK